MSKTNTGGDFLPIYIKKVSNTHYECLLCNTMMPKEGAHLHDCLDDEYGAELYESNDPDKPFKWEYAFESITQDGASSFKRIMPRA